MKQYHHIEKIQTTEPISIIKLDEDINSAIRHCDITDGFVIISSRHTTTGITINEYEPRLLEDMKIWLSRLVPKSDKYLHNDISERNCPPDEPENAHSHLMAMLLGSSESIPIANRKMQLGEYQSVMLIDLDGPRERTINIQVFGDVRQPWR
jgi:secondary thiamine-phosphate synthase enzyme